MQGFPGSKSVRCKMHGPIFPVQVFGRLTGLLSSIIFLCAAARRKHASPSLVERAFRTSSTPKIGISPSTTLPSTLAQPPRQRTWSSCSTRGRTKGLSDFWIPRYSLATGLFSRSTSSVIGCWKLSKFERSEYFAANLRDTTRQAKAGTILGGKKKWKIQIIQIRTRAISAHLIGRGKTPLAMMDLISRSPSKELCNCDGLWPLIWIPSICSYGPSPMKLAVCHGVTPVFWQLQSKPVRIDCRCAADHVLFELINIAAAIAYQRLTVLSPPSINTIYPDPSILTSVYP